MYQKSLPRNKVWYPIEKLPSMPDDKRMMIDAGWEIVHEGVLYRKCDNPLQEAIGILGKEMGLTLDGVKDDIPFILTMAARRIAVLKEKVEKAKEALE